MGVSINLYRVSKAEKLDDLKELNKELENSISTKVDLYKMSEDLAIIFLNEIEPFNDIETIPYKMLFGNSVPIQFDLPQIGGFIPSSDISAITDWIEKHNLKTFEGFSEMHTNLSDEVKTHLQDIDSPDAQELYSGYVKPLINFYSQAIKLNNSVVICGE